MFRENAYYGHDVVLARYAGVAPQPLPGALQHGWTWGAGTASGPAPPRHPLFLWSRRNLEQAVASGYPRCVPIGSPWLYMDHGGLPEPRDRSLLAFPFHGWEHGAVDSVLDGYTQYADHLLELAGDDFDHLGVNLYWLEHAQDDIRAVFEERGFEVLTAGARDANPGFLDRLAGSMARFSTITSNRVATCSFYALTLGRPYFLSGPDMRLTGETGDVVGGSVWCARELPELLRTNFDGSVRREIGERELGAEFRLEPSVLAELMGWSGRGRAERFGLGLDRAAKALARGIGDLFRR